MFFSKTIKFNRYGYCFMYIALNRFKVRLGREQEFENIWKNRESHLEGVPGFHQFNLIKGGSTDNHCLYASHSVWESEQVFVDWTKSEIFVKHTRMLERQKIYI